MDDVLELVGPNPATGMAVHPLLNMRQNPFSKPKRRLSSALARRINSRALPRASALTGLASGKSSACAIDRECYFPTESIRLEGFFLLRDCEAVELRLKSSVAMTLGMSWVSLHGTERFPVGGRERRRRLIRRMAGWPGPTWELTSRRDLS